MPPIRSHSPSSSPEPRPRPRGRTYYLLTGHTPPSTLPACRSRINRADERARYHMSHPNPVDRWVMRVSRFNAPPIIEDLSQFEVKCKFEMIRSNGFDDDSGFVDPDHYVLYLTAQVPPSAGLPSWYMTSPRIVVAWFDGDRHQLDSPQWTQWEDGYVKEFFYNRGMMAKLFIHLAFHVGNLLRGRSVIILEWARIASTGTMLENSLKQRLVRSGFPEDGAPIF
ncbi:hypothetical protein EUX98_g9132 [Antrodiella citrinella]|uniref:Uncharacterized protein n=1 Tax=Antrodiella citrinella TaxID=2447956 RepID=A0A4S4LXT7_9APHY|nr:hypothetical protein EUX98_g9132 [Antrodiella citrinella]